MFTYHVEQFLLIMCIFDKDKIKVLRGKMIVLAMKSTQTLKALKIQAKKCRKGTKLRMRGIKKVRPMEDITVQVRKMKMLKSLNRIQEKFRLMFIQVMLVSLFFSCFGIIDYMHCNKFRAL